jgi:hypothetical protein
MAVKQRIYCRVQHSENKWIGVPRVQIADDIFYLGEHLVCNFITRRFCSIESSLKAAADFFTQSPLAARSFNFPCTSRGSFSSQASPGLTTEDAAPVVIYALAIGCVTVGAPVT